MDIPEQKILEGKENESVESDFSSNKTFTKRAGTTDKGKDYENLMVANLILRLMNNNNIKDFNVWSNDQDFGQFDDVIVEIETKDNDKEKYALQLKHISKETKKLSIKGLQEEKGNFGMRKYFQSFIKSRKTLSNYKLILLTTLDFNVDENQEIQLKTQKDEIVRAQIIKSPITSTLNTNQKVETCYKFELINDESLSNQADYKSFFEIFLLYTNQMNADDLKAEIVSTMKKTFSCTDATAEKILDFISEWSLRDGTKEKLHLKMVQKVVALYLVEPYIQPIFFCEVSENAKILRKAIDKFDICLFGKDLVENVAQLWDDVKEDLDEKEMVITNRNYQIVEKLDFNSVSNEDYSKLLWLINKCPLIVTVSELTYKGVRLCEDRKFILIGENINEEFLEKRSIFRKLSNLKCHSDLLEEVNGNFKCLLPQEEVSLYNLVQHDEKFWNVVTTDELVMMLNGPYKIKQDTEELSLPYITRKLSKSIVSLECLKNVDKDTLILISNYNLNKDIEKCNVTYLDEDFKSLPDNLPQAHVYVTRKMSSQKEFLALCQQNADKKSFHHFRIWNGFLEWMKSVNDISVVENHLVQGYSIEENDLWETTSWNNIHIIASDPGFGKSSLMKNLKNTFSSKIFTVTFSPQDMKEICKYLQSPNLLDYIIDLKFSSYKEFDKSVVKFLFQKNQVMFFWDELDEIIENINCDDNINIVVGVIQKFSDKGIAQWLTCRRRLKYILEAKFCVCAREILAFTEEQQLGFIKERMKPLHCDDQNLDDVKNNVALTRFGDVLSIPLQIHMFTELCKQNEDKFFDVLKEGFSVADMYHYFVEEKFNFYYKDKVKVYTEQKNQLRQMQNDHIKQYQKAAMKALLGGGVLEQVNIDCDDFLNDVQQEGDCFGFITEVTENTLQPVFAHVSYAEYFVATYLLKRKGENLVDILFKDKNSNVRFFFDALLAKGCSRNVEG
ncbi:uncharacterized protein LOC135138012 [Zophobas morio]|uniref:uncharacterized protein LOC135138012 n=1 Tax=Zophobas morio TaxID=2755281 RepID=UPI00308272C2